MTPKQRLVLSRELTKNIPIVLSLLFVTYSTLIFFGIQTNIFNYLGGTSIITLLYLWCNSYTYGLCTHHRMFIYYMVFANIICIIDDRIGIPISDFEYWLVFVISFGLAVIWYGYLKFRDNIKEHGKISKV